MRQSEEGNQLKATHRATTLQHTTSDHKTIRRRRSGAAVFVPSQLLDGQRYNNARKDVVEDCIFRYSRVCGSVASREVG